MSILIAILSCRIHAENGINQAQRDTWLSDIPTVYESKFVIGDGTPVEDSEVFLNAWKGRSCRYENANKKVTYSSPYHPRVDELVVNVPDDYMHVVCKSKQVDQWALDKGYNWVFHCCTDTYANVNRLLNSDFEKYDLYGGGNGGEGHWTSRRALDILANSEVDTWNDDGWRIGALKRHGIELHVDCRYTGWPRFPAKDNDIITSHLNTSPDTYDIRRMYNIHKGLL